MYSLKSSYIFGLRSVSLPQAVVETRFLYEEMDRLGSEFEIVARAKRGIKVFKPICEGFDEIGSYWNRNIFFPENPEYTSSPVSASLLFNDVKCKKLNGKKQGQLSCALMVDPVNPIYSRLFKFTFWVNLYKRSIEVELDNGNFTKDGSYVNFLVLLDACKREFYQEGGEVFFNSRKSIRRAKQRYLFWLKREGRLSSSLKKIYDGFNAQRQKQKNSFGNLRYAESNWHNLISREICIQDY